VVDGVAFAGTPEDVRGRLAAAVASQPFEIVNWRPYPAPGQSLVDALRLGGAVMRSALP
jgi:hypothetical protein